MRPEDQDRLSDDDVLAAEWKKAIGSERSGLIDLFRSGADFEAYLETHKEIRELAKLAYDKVSAAAEVLFSSSDITSLECRKAHFAGRVGLEVISWMNTVLVDGKSAEQALLAEQDMDAEQEQLE